MQNNDLIEARDVQSASCIKVLFRWELSFKRPRYMWIGLYYVRLHSPSSSQKRWALWDKNVNGKTFKDGKIQSCWVKHCVKLFQATRFFHTPITFHGTTLFTCMTSWHFFLIPCKISRDLIIQQYLFRGVFLAKFKKCRLCSIG